MWGKAHEKEQKHLKKLEEWMNSQVSHKAVVLGHSDELKAEDMKVIHNS